jgi:uncharacterized protein (UPF0264 family)
MLASVRDLAEARIVAACAVDWIDLKDPAHGALGAVEVSTVTAVVAEFGASFSVSATIGDCWETPAVIPPRVAAMQGAGAAYVKVGVLAREASPSLLDALRQACAQPARVIAVCFAEAPPGPRDLAALAATGIVGVMLDTALKDGPPLRALLDEAQLAGFVRDARNLGLLCGLAGRLAPADVPALRALAPDYLGFRGALCDAASRSGPLDERRVRDLRRALSADV